MLNSAQTITTGDRVYQELRDLIVSNRIRPGDRLVQRQLAAQFGTSNIPVVEAIRRLERDGLVTAQSNAGATVRLWTLDDIEGIYLVREALDGVACRLFAQRASAVERQTLVHLGAKFDACCRKREFQAGREADMALHRHIVTGAKSAMLSHWVENSSLIAVAIQNLHESNPKKIARSGPAGVHDELIRALTSGNPSVAEEAGRAHVRDALAVIIQVMTR